MATKDWEKDREKSNIITWWNNNKKEGVSIVQFMNNNGKWSFTSEGKTIKDFKTKSQALAYAKSYMRKN